MKKQKKLKKKVYFLFLLLSVFVLFRTRIFENNWLSNSGFQLGFTNWKAFAFSNRSPVRMRHRLIFWIFLFVLRSVFGDSYATCRSTDQITARWCTNLILSSLFVEWMDVQFTPSVCVNILRFFFGLPLLML